MNSKKVLILLSLLLILIVTFTAYLTTLPQTDYQIAVNRLQKISLEAVEQKIQHQESFYLIKKAFTYTHGEKVAHTVKNLLQS